jgi:ArsR family transcriptional regulator, arsenate/arsenite/antimonite-responsive transcriptional repressor / arsenate reductase (thioredoxin)
MIEQVGERDLDLEQGLDLEQRARAHRALGDEHRVRITDLLHRSDRTPGELAALTGMPTNLLAFHLKTLEEAGLVERRRSEGDSRRRYVCLREAGLDLLAVDRRPPVPERVVFVCTHNSARSQFAEALWRESLPGEAWSAGTDPADRVHPRAVAAGRRFGVDLSGLRPKGYGAVPHEADLIVTVCDRASESEPPLVGTRMHWSIPDPVGKDPDAFEAAFADIAARIRRLGE